MMARTKRSRRSYGAGEWGRNRVRVFPALLTRRAKYQCSNGLRGLSIHNAPGSIPHCSPRRPAAPRPPAPHSRGRPRLQGRPQIPDGGWRDGRPALVERLHSPKAKRCEPEYLVPKAAPCTAPLGDEFVWQAGAGAGS